MQTLFAFGWVPPAVTALGGGRVTAACPTSPRMSQAAGMDMVRGRADETPSFRQLLAPLTPSSCKGDVQVDPLCKRSYGAQAEIRSKTPKCCGEARQEPAFSICKEPPGLGTPGQAASEDWERRVKLPAFFLPIPQAEDPSDLGCTQRWRGGCSWQWAAGWLGRAGL